MWTMPHSAMACFVDAQEVAGVQVRGLRNERLEIDRRDLVNTFLHQKPWFLPPVLPQRNIT